MGIVEDVKRTKLEDTAREIIAKANAVRDIYGSLGFLEELFRGVSVEEGEDVRDKVQARGFNYITGGITALENIDILKSAAKMMRSDKAEGMVDNLVSSYDQICVDAVVTGLESGRIHPDSASLSDDEFLAKWKVSSGETEKSIGSEFNKIYAQTNSEMQALYMQQTQNA